MEVDTAYTRDDWRIRDCNYTGANHGGDGGNIKSCVAKTPGDRGCHKAWQEHDCPHV
jgi:hypothetical protein